MEAKMGHSEVALETVLGDPCTNLGDANKKPTSYPGFFLQAREKILKNMLKVSVLPKPQRYYKELFVYEFPSAFLA